MEELLVVLVQIVVEVAVQAIVYLPFDFSFYRSEGAGDSGACGWVVLYLVLGSACGGLSVLVAPHVLLPSPALRLVNLVVAPLAAGGLSWAISRRRRARGTAIDPPIHGLYAFVFALAFAAVRLAYAARG